MIQVTMTVPRPLVVLGHLWVLAAMIHAAAVPTQDTLVVTKVEESTDPILSDPNPSSTPAIEPTTEEHAPPIKLTEMDVKSVVTMRYAHTAVVAHVRNPAKRAQEANFRVLLPETAFISGFVMTLDGKSYKAYVKEKEEAKQIYQEAVSQGFGAAHIAAKARDSNHFTVSVNVEPASTAIFNLTYEELLVRRNEVYNYVINLHPGALVPKFTVTVNIKESSNITELRVPEIRSGNEIDATKNDAQMSNVIIEREGLSAVIKFSPDLEEQKRLMHVYAEKSKESATGKSEGEGVLGQFVVQYDVDRSKQGEILVNDGYFVHFFAPELPPLNKYVVFVLDTSGSMMGTKITQLQQAMQTILGEMDHGDYFSIVDFDSTVSVHDLSEVDKEPPKRNYYYNERQAQLNLVDPYQATTDNIEKARTIISRLEAYGGTNIYSALNVAIDLINKPAENKTSDETSNASSTTVPTPTTNDVVEKKESDKKNEAKKLEPIIIFLTDGDPTVGETNTRTIINHLTEKNYGENKATIFTLGFGDDADRKFLRKLSLRNDGFMRHIYEAADAPLQLRDFYRQVSSPVLAHVKFVYPADQVNEETTTKHRFRTFYAGSELVVAGRMISTATDLESQVEGFCGVLDDGYLRKKFEKKVKVPIPEEKRDDFPLERLWAYLTIKQLLDEKDASDGTSNDPSDENNPEKKALRLALKYSFVTSLTSLVVVKPNETNAVNAESLDKQNNYQFGYQALSIPSAGGPGASFAAYGAVPLSSSAYINRGGLGGYPNSAYPSSYSFNHIAHIAHAHRPLVLHRDRNPTRTTLYGTRRKVHRPVVLRGRYPSHVHPSLFTHSIRRKIYKPQVLHRDAVGLTTPFYGPIPTYKPMVLTPPPPGLHTYHLEDFSWIESLLNFSNDTVILQANETVTLKLSRDTQVPKAAGGDVNCGNAVEGGDGLCVYLTRCSEAHNITIDLYKTNYCVVDGGYAGVCCHRHKIDLVTV